jgi:hypothetical protein
MIQTSKVLLEVADERTKQNNKWGEQNHNLTTWIAILGEEYGEAAKEAVDYCCDNPPSKAEELEATKTIMLNRLLRYRKELIQTAAVAVQMIESLDSQRIIKSQTFIKTSINNELRREFIRKDRCEAVFSNWPNQLCMPFAVHEILESTTTYKVYDDSGRLNYKALEKALKHSISNINKNQEYNDYQSRVYTLSKTKRS